MTSAKRYSSVPCLHLGRRYQLQEDPKARQIITMPLPKGQCYSRLAFGPDSVLAAAFGNTIHFWEVNTSGDSKSNGKGRLLVCGFPLRLF